MYGFDVYSAEVDDKGIDFVIRKNENQSYGIQVKSDCNLSYIIVRIEECELRNNLLISVVLFTNLKTPSRYLIPSIAWNHA